MTLKKNWVKLGKGFTQPTSPTTPLLEANWVNWVVGVQDFFYFSTLEVERKEDVSWG